MGPGGSEAAPRDPPGDAPRLVWLPGRRCAQSLPPFSFLSLFGFIAIFVMLGGTENLFRFYSFTFSR